MTFQSDQPIREAAKAIHAVYRRSWWKFWLPKITEQDVYRAVTHALTGDPEPLARLGVTLPPSIQECDHD